MFKLIGFFLNKYKSFDVETMSCACWVIRPDLFIICFCDVLSQFKKFRYLELLHHLHPLSRTPVNSTFRYLELFGQSFQGSR